MRAVVQRVLEASVTVIETIGADSKVATVPAQSDDILNGGNPKSDETAPERREQEIARIGRGFLVLIGVHLSDTLEDAHLLAEKVANLRVLEDAAGKLNLSLLDRGQDALVVSNFTLYGDCRKGRRPSFTEAASGTQAETLYLAFGTKLAEFGVPVQYGKFGAEMHVALINDGPITLLLDSKKGF